MRKDSDPGRKRMILYIILQIVVITVGTIVLMLYLQYYQHIEFLTSDGDVSGWAGLIISTSIGIFISLAIMAYSDYYQDVLSEIAEETKDIALQQHRILQEQELLRQRRLKYAIYDIKNHFTTLLFTVGFVNRLVIEFNKKEDGKEEIIEKINEHMEKIKPAIEAIRSTLYFANDTLDPSLMEEINSVCKLIGESSTKEENGKLEFSYDDMKKKIYEVTGRLPVFENKPKN
ncbi:hypothetical protein DYY67_1359 [Candidatus Nitrosotalea sp. TS]|uniref:hypothetical protein n=1 Tax=Candidatus Nitrosotalea sp. TS TaxID=2341020 RepID=UPI001409C94E|nr:hypothetical protein [Candidatus Nitrosotalea sp. TS]NHI03564.1 hypothetical protein [Candidatus Nitrosotalea sp. TS]